MKNALSNVALSENSIRHYGNVHMSDIVSRKSQGSYNALDLPIWLFKYVH